MAGWQKLPTQQSKGLRVLRINLSQLIIKYVKYFTSSDHELHLLESETKQDEPFKGRSRSRCIAEIGKPPRKGQTRQPTVWGWVRGKYSSLGEMSLT